MNKKFLLWQRWLEGFALFTALFGLIMALFYQTPLFRPLESGISSVFWPSPVEITPAIKAYSAFLIGLLGSLMAAWGTSMAFVIHYAFKKQERWAWNCLLASLLAWFLIDESFSIAGGVIINAVFNLVFLAALLIPLLFTRKYFL